MTHPPPPGAGAPPPPANGGESQSSGRSPSMFFVNRVQIGSENMCKVGIFAKASVDVYTARPEQGGRRWVTINEITIRYSHKNQKYFPSLPSKEYTTRNGKQYQPIALLFPEAKNLWYKWQDEMIKDFLAECQRIGVQPGQPAPQGTYKGSGGQGRGQGGGNGGGSTPAPTPARAPAPSAPLAGTPSPAPAPAAAPPAPAPAPAQAQQQEESGSSDLNDLPEDDIPF